MDWISPANCIHADGKRRVSFARNTSGNHFYAEETWEEFADLGLEPTWNMGPLSGLYPSLDAALAAATAEFAWLRSTATS